MNKELQKKQRELLEQLGAVPLTQKFMDRILSLVDDSDEGDVYSPLDPVTLGCVFDFKDLTILGTYKPFTAIQQGVCPEVNQISVNGVGDNFNDVILNAYSHAVWLKEQHNMKERYSNLDKRGVSEVPGYRGVF